MLKLWLCLSQTCFFRQFGRSVVRADYLTLRKGFIMVCNILMLYKIRINLENGFNFFFVLFKDMYLIYIDVFINYNCRKVLYFQILLNYGLYKKTLYITKIKLLYCPNILAERTIIYSSHNVGEMMLLFLFHSALAI